MAVSFSTEVFTELQKPELVFGVPVVFLVLILPSFVGLPILFGVIFFIDSIMTVLIIGGLFAFILFLAGYVLTKVDPEWMECAQVRFKILPMANWPIRSGRHYHG